MKRRRKLIRALKQALRLTRDNPIGYARIAQLLADEKRRLRFREIVSQR